MGEWIASLTHNLTAGAREHRAPRTAPDAFTWLWLLAGLVAAAVLLPVLYLLVRVLGAGQELPGLLLRAEVLAILARTAGLAVAVTALSVVLAVPLAWLTVSTDLPLRRMWAVLATLPVVIPSYVGAYLMVASIGPRGMLSHGLSAALGGISLPSIYGFPGALVLLTLLSYPYILMSVRAALQGLDPSLAEAGRSLGLSPWRTFWRVTLPQLRPAIASGSLLVALYVLRDFGAVSILRYDTFTRVIYVQYKSAFDRSSAAGLALVLVLLTLVMLAVELRLRRGANYERNAAGGWRRAPVVRLGRWRWPALLFCAGVVSLALFMPLGVLAYWLGRGLLAGERLLSLWDALRGSFVAAGLAAGVTLLAAAPVAILSVRRPGRWSAVLERASYIGHALPGLVIALALVFLGVNFALPLYQTLPMLVLAYVILFLPQAVGALNASLLQVSPRLEEAARSLGRRSGQALAEVTLPLVRPGVLAALGLVFLTAMKELPATLILSPLGFRSLAMMVWAAVSEAFFAQAAAPALLLILTSSLPMAFLILKERT